MVKGCGSCISLLAEVERNLKSKATHSYSDNRMPQYLEVASGFVGAGIEILASRGALELDKSQGWNINEPYMRARTWVDWGTGLVSAVALFWKGERIRARYPKLYEAIQGVGHAAIANSAPHIEEQATGIKPYRPIPQYTQRRTITPATGAPGKMQIKSQQIRPGEIDVIAMAAPPLTLG